MWIINKKYCKFKKFFVSVLLEKCNVYLCQKWLCKVINSDKI